LTEIPCHLQRRTDLAHLEKVTRWSRACKVLSQLKQRSRNVQRLQPFTGARMRAGSNDMMYHLKKDPPKTKPVVFRQPVALYLTAKKRPSVILKIRDESRPAPASARPS
jgi:hypothetical protein